MPTRHALSLFSAVAISHLVVGGAYAAQSGEAASQPAAPKAGAEASVQVQGPSVEAQAPSVEAQAPSVEAEAPSVETPSVDAEAPSVETQDPYMQADGDAAFGAPEATPKESPFRRWRPKGFMTEVGIFGGAFWLPKEHEFYGGKNSTTGALRWRDYPKILPEVGLRLGIYPAGAFGIELEGSVLPTEAKAVPTANLKKASALFFSGRGHIVLQLPAANLVPFILGGAGVWGVYSKNGSGKDADLGVHFGGGLKYYASKYIAIRVDVRDVMLPKRWDGKKTPKLHNLEVLAGLSATFGRKEEAPPPPPPPPPPPSDRDGDGIPDTEDACPDEPETFNDFEDEDGCPESDRDGDGFWDRPDQDACPDEPGVAPDGCPIRDSDNDGILDPDDQCPQEPETMNSYQDEDGCPDEVPKEEVAQFSGTIRGILFNTGKSTIQAQSEALIDQAVELFQKYPTLKVEIVGHTDSKGSETNNQILSQARADAVKTYMVSKGVDASRVTTRGAGEAEPVDTNRTRAGRANNRRIEFKITQN